MDLIDAPEPSHIEETSRYIFALVAELRAARAERDELALRLAETQGRVVEQAAETRLRALDAVADELRETQLANQRVFAMLHAELVRIRNEGRS